MIRRKRLVEAVVLVGAIGVGLAGASTSALGAGDKAGQDGPKDPLVLRKQGSFFVGGQTESTGPNSDITIDQMYVQFQVPERAGRHLPVVMLHGCCLSGKTWETTPDGRMGWAEYFVRRHRPTYIPDQVSRARSGFDSTTIRQVKSGTLPPSALPNIFQATHQVSWTLFRFGPTFNTVFSDEQFPVDAADELYKQMIPDLNALLPAVNPTWTNLAALADQLGGAVLMGHSESGFFPEQAALINPAGIRGVITIETAFCVTNLTPQQLSIFRNIPVLVVFGDHLADVPAFANLWTTSLNTCNQFVQQVNAAGGDAQLMSLPAIGVFGNSHMMMQDKNNLEVADLILQWIDEHVEGR
jgi:pimeloyl-ACP methyl ester carboxylesterase